LKKGRLSAKDFLAFMRNFPFSDERHIKLDFHRKLRQRHLGGQHRQRLRAAYQATLINQKLS
jgi:hypothetical protein